MGHFRVVALVPLMLVFLGLFHESSENVIYYLTPSSSQRCPEKNCQHLSEFSANVSNDDDNITIVLIPGKHSLNQNLSLSNLISLSLYSLTDSSATIECASSGFISFEDIERVYIHNVNFVGCGGNLVKNVDEFILQETTFEGVRNSGTALTIMNTTADIIDCTFVRNQFGTVMEGVRSLRIITSDINWFLVGDVTGIVRVGGAIISSFSNISISGSNFEDNRADIGGDIFTEDFSQISIFNSNFSGEGIDSGEFIEEAPFGGAIFSHEGDFTITECQFRNKNTTVGGGIMSSLSNFMINDTIFSQNSATDHGASVFGYDSTISLDRCTFEQNYAGAGAGVATQEGILNVDASSFIDNVAERHAAALDLFQDSPTVRGCVFKNNVARSFAGAILLWFSNMLMYGKVTPEGGAMQQSCNESCSEYGAMIDVSLSTPGNQTVFYSNSAPTGASLYVIRSSVRSCGPIYFSENRATLYSSVYYLDSVVSFEGFVQLSKNLGSLFAFNSHLNFSDCSRFVDGLPQRSMVSSFREGGALTLIQSRLTISGKSTFEGNSAETGGAIAATDSEIFLNDEINIMNNTAYKSGGGVYLSQSDFHALRESAVTISNNRAERGGGIHAVSSSIKCTVTGSDYSYQDEIRREFYEGAVMTIRENAAQRGGALFMEANSRVTLLKDYLFYTLINVSGLKFMENRAMYGGAIYVDDQSNSGSCASNPFDANAQQSECFIHVIATEAILTADTNYILTNILFESNIADVSGSTIFGGLLDRCTVSVFNEVDRTLDLSDNQFLTYEGDGLEYLFDISIGNTKESISSDPVQLCPCFNGQPNCSQKVHRDVQIRKGEEFTLSVMAVDQVFNPTSATAQAILLSTESNLFSGQVSLITYTCTDVSFRISSSRNSEELTLYASDGPCKDAELSQLKINVTFLPCTCPIGFEPSQFSSTFCFCTCHPRISPFVESCNVTLQTVQRTVNAWISYVNSTNPSSRGYLVHLFCPFDYCVPPNMSVPLNLSSVNGADSQCALNRTSVLCGACKPGLSLSLGSSKCLECPNYWPVFFVVITIFSFLAGLGLVALILWLNMTVAVGTLNGLLFYANIVSANRVVLLPYPEPNLITVFISWLNLELGIDVCYIKGMDVYIRTWLQLAFPIYIILLVVLLILVSRYSTRFSTLISKRDPVATLATLILISYGKLFHVVLLAQPFSFAALTYPDHSEILWLPDGTVRYLSGKHVILFIVALLILIVCVGYGLLLFFWQLILRLPNWKVFKCLRNPKFNLFMATYTFPYVPRHRYWTGMLLLARAVLYLVAAANVSGNPQIQLISIIFVLMAIVFLKFVAARTYKNTLIDILDSFFYVNIIFLASFTSYNLATGGNQDGAAYTSVCLAIFMTIFIILYHIHENTSLFASFYKTKCGKMVKKRSNPKSSKKHVVEYPTSNSDDSLRRYDDILELSNLPAVWETNYCDADSRAVPQKPACTSSELVINES
jgi:predicted outer membrane repeat protein